MSENAKKWNSGGLAGDYASLRKELDEKERALTAANEQLRIADERRVLVEHHLRSSLEKAKGEMRGMVGAQSLLSHHARVYLRHRRRGLDLRDAMKKADESMWNVLERIASRSKGEGL